MKQRHPPDALGEVIAIDDGSDDGIAAEIKARLRTHPCLCYLRHGHRAGQSAALHRRAGGAVPRSSPPWMATAKTIRPIS
ncbi:MAG: glycosyltransferase [Methyloceanibacter sp.]